MDPIGVAASLGAVIQLSFKAAQALKEIKNGSEDWIRLREEIRGTACLLEILRDRVEDAESDGKDLMSIHLLGEAGGPLDQLHHALEQLLRILAPQKRLHQISRALLWPLSKEDVINLVNVIGRQKTAFGLAIQNDNIALSLAIKAQMSDMSTKFAAMEHRLSQSHKHAPGQEHQAILAWLSPLNFWPRHQDIASTRTEGTGTWLIASDEFQAWRRHLTKLLWCAGMPGAGKSVLASVVIDHLSHTVVDEKHGLAFVYCNYKERAQQTQNNLISSLINQLIASTGDFPSDLGPLYHRHSLKGTKPSQSELFSLLGSIASGFEHLFLVIYALDEYDDSEGIRDALIPTLHAAVPNACIHVTSRPYVNPQSSDVSRLEIRTSGHDIRRYLRNQILRQPKLKRHTQADPSLLALIEDTIVRKSDGMFLLAQLHIGALATKNTRKALRSALQFLPIELNTTYDDALYRINDQNNEDASLAKNVLILTQISSDGYTPIHLASRKGHLEAVRLFLDHGVPPDIRDKAGHTPLQYATFRGSLETVELLLERGANIMAQNHAGETALHTCIRYSPDKDVVSLLLRRGFKIDVSNARGQTPLHTAARRGHGSIVKLLIDYGADATLETRDGWTPLEEAAASGAKDIVDVLREHGSDDRSHGYVDLMASACLRESISTQDLDTVEELLQKPDIDTGVPDCDGRTGLHYAAYNGQTEVTVALLKRGAFVNAQIDDSAYNDSVDYIGNIPHEVYQHQLVTPLQKAVGKGHADIVEILLNYGASVNVVGCQGYTVLKIAAKAGYANVAKLLLEHGSAFDKSTDGDEPTLLYWVASAGHEDVVRLLLEHGADEDRNGEWGKKALVNAVQRNFTGIVKLLKDHGFSTAER
ncbi:MAG: hypothetical protein L6R37_007496 [Teloschistes peruensis]|nr:MAG: hypothetical protein L6R37_007496 [Teloschistes peruensis]